MKIDKAKLMPEKEPSKINEMAYKKIPELKNLHKKDMRKFKIKDPNGIESNIVLSYTMFSKLQDDLPDGEVKERFGDLLEKYGKAIQQIGVGIMKSSVIMILIAVFISLIALTIMIATNSTKAGIAVFASLPHIIIAKIMFEISIFLLILGSMLRLVGYVSNKIDDKKDKCEN